MAQFLVKYHWLSPAFVDRTHRSGPILHWRSGRNVDMLPMFTSPTILQPHLFVLPLILAPCLYLHPLSLNFSTNCNYLFCVNPPSPSMAFASLATPTSFSLCCSFSLEMSLLILVLSPLPLLLISRFLTFVLLLLSHPLQTNQLSFKNSSLTTNLIFSASLKHGFLLILFLPLSTPWHHPTTLSFMPLALKVRVVALLLSFVPISK